MDNDKRKLTEKELKRKNDAVPCPAGCWTGRAFLRQLYLADKRAIDFDFLSAEIAPRMPGYACSAAAL